MSRISETWSEVTMSNVLLSLLGSIYIEERYFEAASIHWRFLPPADEVWGKVMFLHVSVILFTGGGFPIDGGLPTDGRESAYREGVGKTPPQKTPPRKAGSTHPTGMLSWFLLSLRWGYTEHEAWTSENRYRHLILIVKVESHW